MHNNRLVHHLRPAAGMRPRIGDFYGAELAGVLAARWPRVPVLFTSGFADADGRLPVTDSTIHFLPKPWTPDQLLAALQQLLDAHRGAPVTS